MECVEGVEAQSWRSGPRVNFDGNHSGTRDIQSV